MPKPLFAIMKNHPDSPPPRLALYHRQHRSAFTLIELLTVIAIIGVLSAITISAIRSARIAAHKARSLSNLRQIHQGLVMYDLENKKLPQLFSGQTGSTWLRPFWNHRILPYMGVKMDPENLSDPFYTKGGYMPGVFQDLGAPRTNTLRGDYGVMYHATAGPIRAASPSLTLSALVKPSLTPLVATVHQYETGNSEPIGSWFFNNIAAPNGRDPEVADRYDGKCIVAFADGRILTLPRDQFYTTYLPFQNN